MQNSYYNANEAFNDLWNYIPGQGQDFDNTKAIFNCGFYIQNPLDNHIKNPIRDWKPDYAEAEWQWYLSGDKNIKKLGEIYGKIPPIWERMADEQGNVNSNYGWQWQRGGNHKSQLEYVIEKLKKHKHTRHATISIYDGKEHPDFKTDTPCTYAIQFTNVENRLNMCVTMRSNDLWYGFCNDQYCFSKLQELVCKETGLDMGSYYHFAHNLHIYSNKLGL